MNEHCFEAWILSVRPSGNDNCVVCAYSREWGKIRLFVPGARKMRSKLRAFIAPFSRSLLRTCQKYDHTWQRLIGGKLVTMYPSLRERLDRITEASWISELLDRMTPLGQRSIEKYHLLGKSLGKIASSSSLHGIRLAFGFSLLVHTGHGIELGICTECQSRDREGHDRWLSNAGLVCSVCRHKVSAVLRVDEKTYRLLLLIQKDPWILETDRVNRVELETLVHVLQFILNHYLTQPLKSESFRKKVLAPV